METEVLKLKQLIDENNLSVARFADKIGISRQGIYDLLNEKTAINMKNLKIFANYFKVPLSYFFDKENTTYTIDAELLAIIKKLTNFDYAMFYGFLKGYGVLAANNGLQQNITPDLLQKLNYDLFVKYKTLVVPEIELLYKKGLICPEFYELLLMLHKR